jgi:uncharacterized protein (TIGR02996 family)
LLAEVLGVPEDDAPRLVWADAQGGPRGELVVLQCELARGTRTAAESGEFRRRQRELLNAHGVEWCGLARFAKRCRFRRGFVELAAFDAGIAAAHLDEILAAAPTLATLEIEDVTAANLRVILEHPGFERLRGFGPQSGSLVDHDAIFQAAAASGAFGNFVALSVPSLGPSTMKELVTSRQLEGLERLALAGPTAALAEVFATTPRLRALDLTFQREFDVISVLPPTLTALEVSAEGLEALARSPLAAQLEVLVVSYIHPFQELSTLPLLGAFPRLRSLDLRTGSHLALEPASFEVGLSPTLRELRYRSKSADTARAVVEKYGAQLELLEITGLAAEDGERLQPLVAGDLWANAYMGAGVPLFAGELARAPAWDYPFVRPPRR